MNQTTSTAWQSISDYEVSPDTLSLKELPPLHDVWVEQKDQIQKGSSFNQFNLQLNREWAIETGLIERLYVFDRGITQLLITNGIVADYIPSSTAQNSKLIESMINDHEAALEYLFGFVKQERSLTPSFIKELHSMITQSQATSEAIDQFGEKVNVPLQKGEFKKQPNNPIRSDRTIHKYCPPEHVDAEIDKLCELHRRHIEAGVTPEVEAAWLHHRFTSIHPFQDGNGRVARALASLVFIRQDWFPLVIRDKDRSQYIKLLEQADQGKLKGLVVFFGELQKKNFLDALSIARTTERTTGVKQQIEETQRRLREKKSSIQKEQNQAVNTVKHLHTFTYRQLNIWCKELTNQLGPQLQKSKFRVFQGEYRSKQDHYYKSQIVEVAKRLDYFADSRTYRSWVRLDMRDGTHGVLLVSFHGFGYDFNGLLACSGMWFEKTWSDGLKSESTPIPLTKEPFVVNYRESLSSVKERFQPWLDECATRAIQCFEMGAFE